MKSFLSKVLMKLRFSSDGDVFLQKTAISHDDEEPVYDGLRRIDYRDGGWCDTHYVHGKNHGNQTFYYANGQKKWERSYEYGVQEGIEQFWDEHGKLTKEVHYQFDVMHGIHREICDKNGEWEEFVFKFGMPNGHLAQSSNPEFCHLVRPHFTETSITNSDDAKKILDKMELDSCLLVKGDPLDSPHYTEDSMWGRINILGEDETWPTRNGVPLAPVLQIKCSDIPDFKHPLKKFAWVTLFAEKDEEFQSFDEAFVLRTYGHHETVREIELPDTEIVVTPAYLSFKYPIQSFPDRNDLPPNLVAYHEQQDMPLVDGGFDMSSRLGGWPSWIQFSSIIDFGPFLLQIDCLDLDQWEYGNSSIFYFFADPSGNGFQGHCDMM